MNNACKALWEHYNEIRQTGNRKQTNQALNEFIALLKQESEEEKHRFVDLLGNALLEKNPQIPSSNGAEISSQSLRIQPPLFKEIIVPVLIDGYRHNRAKQIKWIGQLEQFFHSDHEMAKLFLEAIEYPGNFEAPHFFEKSYMLDHQPDTLEMLLEKTRERISYCLHEIPYGVPVDPDELNEKLNIFEHYLAQSENKMVWQNVLQKWKQLARQWADYHQHKNMYDSFANYLDKNR